MQINKQTTNIVAGAVKVTPDFNREEGGQVCRKALLHYFITYYSLHKHTGKKILSLETERSS